MSRRVLTRDDDNRDLAVLEAYCRGGNMRMLNRRLGLSAAFGSELVKRIRLADLSESGEPRAVVAAAYVRGGR